MKIGITGATGRMGKALVAALSGQRDMRLGAAITNKGDAALGLDAGRLAGVADAGVLIGDDAEAFVAASDVIVDFTRPQPSVYYATLAAKHGKAMVCGTTGLDDSQFATLNQLAKEARLLWSPNMSLGVNVLVALVEQTARLLGPEYDIELVEMHHRHKADAPSGTAMALAEAAARGRNVSLKDEMVHSRHGFTGERRPGSIGMAVLRGGDVVGDHTVMFAAEGERLELTHKASKRDVFAHGALAAARWLAGQKAGKLWHMKDMVGSLGQK
ncbi:4-hydroxy-tetrahydrodipicolinate reductase [bacterium]|nr:4-hydroxy-tetrahydrodipicolinate reductase [bacterium]